MQKVIKDIGFGTIEDAKRGSIDLALRVNNIELIDMDLNEAIKILYGNKMIKDDMVIIPAGCNLKGIKNFGGAYEYEFEGDNLHVLVDLCFDGDEWEYIA